MTRSFHRNSILVLATDVLVVAFSWYFSHLLRFNFHIPQPQFQTLIRLLPLMIGIKVLAFPISAQGRIRQGSVLIDLHLNVNALI
jgi:hypothetical protein